jgi:hypothetical protein
MISTAARPLVVPPQPLVVLDPMTGRELAALGRWELAQGGFDGPLIGVRQHPDGGMVIAELDVHAGKARVLDVLPDVTGNCQAVVGLLLLCQLVDGSYQLFRVPR